MTRKKNTARAGKPAYRFITPPSCSSSSLIISFQSLLGPSPLDEADVRVSIRSAGWLTNAPAIPLFGMIQKKIISECDV
jgi:hypothetical protein